MIFVTFDDAGAVMMPLLESRELHGCLFCLGREGNGRSGDDVLFSWLNTFLRKSFIFFILLGSSTLLYLARF